MSSFVFDMTSYNVFFYIPGRKTIASYVYNSDKIDVAINLLGDDTELIGKDKYLMAGGVILNRQFTFGFYEEVLKQAKYVIYVVGKPNVRRSLKSFDGCQKFLKRPEAEKLKEKIMWKLEKGERLSNKLIELYDHCRWCEEHNL